VFDEFKARYGTTLVTGFARIQAMPGASSPKTHPFSESANKGAHSSSCARTAHPLVFCRTSQLHGRPQVRERRDCTRRREDGHRGGVRTGAEVHDHHRRLLRRGQLRHVRRAYSPRFLWMWPNARISVMGGEQAASVLATVRRDGIEARGGSWSKEDEEAFRAPIREQYEVQGHPYYATARIWDDGIIDPADTRTVLALAMSASLNAPIPEPRFGVFRM